MANSILWVLEPSRPKEGEQRLHQSPGGSLKDVVMRLFKAPEVSMKPDVRSEQ